MPTPTDFEQLVLEYTNRARMNPGGEFDALIADAGTVTGAQGNITSALRYFGVDLDALQTQFDALEAAAPLAWNMALARAAEGHSEQMILFDTQSHQLPGEPSLGARIQAEGYSFSTAAENVFAYTRDPLHGHAGFFIDWGYDDADFSGNSLVPNWQSIGDGIQDAAGHRVAIMNPGFTEVGMSALDDSADDAIDEVGPYVLTQNFGNRFDYAPQLLGVIIDDTDGDQFYDIGEGLGGLTISATGAAGTFVTTSWSSGGYQMELPKGDYTVTISGDALEGEIVFDVTMGLENIKRDAFAEDAVGEPPASGTDGTAGDDALIGSSADDIMAGLAGADTLQGLAGDDMLHGDVLPLAVVADIAGQIYRLYQATLGRTPDATGFQSWVERMFAGELSLEDVVGNFLQSSEFQTVYGGLDNTGFVSLLYENVLGRTGNTSEVQGWTAQMDVGMSRDQVVLGFSESTEFREDTSGMATMAAEDASAPGWQDDVFRLYQATLDRLPDVTGFLGWVAQLAGGRAYLDVVQAFVSSPEFSAVYGPQEDGDFVELLYQNVLDRASDPGGRQGWLDMLDAGGTRAEVVRGFAQSTEFREATAADLESWIRDLGVQDVLAGGGGANILTGGVLSDRFVFSPADGGSHAVLDLEAWDQLDLTGFGYGLAAAARLNMSEAGADLIFADQGVTVTFHNTQMSDITDTMLLI